MKTFRFRILAQCHYRWLIQLSFIHPIIHTFVMQFFFWWMYAETFLVFTVFKLSAFSLDISAQKVFYCMSARNFPIAVSTVRQFNSIFATLSCFFFLTPSLFSPPPSSLSSFRFLFLTLSHQIVSLNRVIIRYPSPSHWIHNIDACCILKH